MQLEAFLPNLMDYAGGATNSAGITLCALEIHA
jgi:hypothetical protein